MAPCKPVYYFSPSVIKILIILLLFFSSEAKLWCADATLARFFFGAEKPRFKTERSFCGQLIQWATNDEKTPYTAQWQNRIKRTVSGAWPLRTRKSRCPWWNRVTWSNGLRQKRIYGAAAAKLLPCRVWRPELWLMFVVKDQAFPRQKVSHQRKIQFS